MLDWYRKLIQLRRETPSLNNGEPGNIEVSYSEERRWLSVRRARIAIVSNLASDAVFLVLDQDTDLILSSQPGVIVENGGITLPPDSIAIVQTCAH
jgi:maltooligosyltrehalose trehalohydrolase